MWKLKDQIKNGTIEYEVGEKVIVFRRKSNGYPKVLKDDIEYPVFKVDGDSLWITLLPSSVGIRINKCFLISRSKLRDFKINSIIINK